LEKCISKPFERSFQKLATQPTIMKHEIDVPESLSNEAQEFDSSIDGLAVSSLCNTRALESCSQKILLVRACLRSTISQLQDKNGAAGKKSTQVHLLRTQRENKQRRNLLFLHNNSQSCINGRRESKKIPLHTQRDNKRRFIHLFLVLAKCPSHSAKRESKSGSWSTKSRSKLEEHSGRRKISNATQGFVLIRNATTTTTTTAIQEQNIFDDSFFLCTRSSNPNDLLLFSSLQQKQVSCNYLTRTDGPRGNRLSAFSERLLQLHK
jgi:hypothetical protein